jgi:hypothetical protein
MAAAKPVPTPEYFGSNPGSSSVPVDSASEGEGDSESDGEVGDDDGDGDIITEPLEDEGLEVLTVEDEMKQEDFESKESLSRTEQVQLLRMILPTTALNVEAVKSGKTLAVRVFVEDEAAAEATKKQFQDELKNSKKDPQYKTRLGGHIKKVLNFVVKNAKTVIKVVPARFKYLSPSPKKASKKSETKGTPDTIGTPASTAIAASLSNSGGAEGAM